MGGVGHGRFFFFLECRLNPEDRFIVMATDGFWEVVNPLACKKIVEAFYGHYSMDVGRGTELGHRILQKYCTGFPCREEAMTMCQSSLWIWVIRLRR